MTREQNHRRQGLPEGAENAELKREIETRFPGMRHECYEVCDRYGCLNSLVTVINCHQRVMTVDPM